MRRQISRITIGVLVATLAATLAGAVTDGSEYLRDCGNYRGSDNPDQLAKALLCTGYTAGVTQTLIGMQTAAEELPCPPVGMTVEQSMDMALAYAEARPEERHMEAAQLIIRALREAFPCQGVER